MSTIYYCLPCPSIDNFSYSADMGVLRTTLSRGIARQRRLYDNQPRTYQLTWQLNTPQLNEWEKFAKTDGYSWHLVPMITGQTSDWAIAGHRIRFTTNYTVTLIAKDLWEVSVQAEQYQLL